MSDYYNPYQFIEPQGLGNDAPGMLELKKLIAGDTYATHDRWQPGHCSGKIVCTLTSKTPVFVGNKHYENQQKAEHYQYNKKTAIPGNSLRGMLSTVCETISDSSLRVLEDRKYSVRKSVNKGLKATGLLKKDESGNYFLIPLSLSDFQKKKHFTQGWKCPEKWKKVFVKENGELLNWEDVLPSYIDNGHKLLAPPINDDEYLFYIRKPRGTCSLNEPLPDNSSLLDKQKVKPRSETSFLIGLKAYRSSISAEPFKGEDCGQVYLRQLENSFKPPNDMPANKKHALLLPYSANRRRLKVSDKVVDSFRSLSLERYQKTCKQAKNNKLAFPIQIRGYRKERAIQPQSKSWDLLNTEIVYFDIDDHGKVTEVSTSAIWREEIKQSSYDFFKQKTNLLPLQDKNRTHLTPAEILFGVIEEQTVKTETQAFALASRVRFSDAIPTKEVNLCEDEIPLKLMLEPKPPSPSLYFHKNDGKYISKSDLNLNTNNTISPNGRKHYIRCKNGQLSDYKNKGDDKNCIKCQPVDKNNEFSFTIYYNNLTKHELGLLYYSINPDAFLDQQSTGGNFYHLIGLGKPIGMGRVSLNIQSIENKDRAIAYFQKVFPNQALENTMIPSDAEKFSRELVKTECIDKLLLLGRDVKELHEVCYPKAKDSNDGFGWFVNNDNPHQTEKYNMGSIGDEIPKMKKNSAPPKKKHNQSTRSKGDTPEKATTEQIRKLATKFNKH